MGHKDAHALPHGAAGPAHLWSGSGAAEHYANHHGDTDVNPVPGEHPEASCCDSLWVDIGGEG